MNPLVPNVPRGSKVSSFLYRGTNPEYLTQDQLTVALPNGYHIDVGWFPEHDPGGCYAIRVFYQFADNERMMPLRVKSLDEMLAVVEFLALHWSRQQVPVAASSVTSFKKFALPG